MGYYTLHNINFYQNDEHLEISEDKSAVVGTTVADSIAIEMFDETCKKLGFNLSYQEVTEDEVKWYDFNKHMPLISALMYDIAIITYGDGEEPDDYWMSITINGKHIVYIGKIAYPDADLSDIRKEEDFIDIEDPHFFFKDESDG